MTVLRPDRESIRIAAEFLASYDGKLPGDDHVDSAEKACHDTAKWLLYLIEKSEDEAAIRAIASEQGVSLSLARAVFQRLKG